MKKPFMEAELDIMTLTVADIITTSPLIGDPEYGGDDGYNGPIV